MDYKDIATVSGKGGLFQVIAPTRGGVILESMDEHKKKLVVSMNSKVSVLGEISIYTTDKWGTRTLQEVMTKIHGEFDGDTGLSGTSDPEELKSFMKFILPEYDEDRVYVSDIKKLVNWYNLLSASYPELFVEEKKEEKTQTPAKAKKTAKKEGKAKWIAEQKLFGAYSLLFRIRVSAMVRLCFGRMERELTTTIDYLLDDDFTVCSVPSLK